MSLPADSAHANVLREQLQERIHLLQGKQGKLRSLPLLPALSPLLPGGLRSGSAYSVQGPLTLAMLLMAGASAQGSWCAVTGVPDFGTEAAAGLGIELSRLILVPEPGERWMPVVAALCDVLPLVVVRPPARPSSAEASRLSSRLRERGAVLLVLGGWPQNEAVFKADDGAWEGLGSGEGHLQRRSLRLESSARGRERHAVVALGPAGLEPPESSSPAGASTPGTSPVRSLNAVASDAS